MYIQVKEPTHKTAQQKRLQAAKAEMAQLRHQVYTYIHIYVYFSAKKHHLSAKEPYLSVKEPHFSAKTAAGGKSRNGSVAPPGLYIYIYIHILLCKRALPLCKEP